MGAGENRPSPLLQWCCLHALALVLELLAQGLVRGAHMALERHDLGVDGVEDPGRLREEGLFQLVRGVIQFLEATTTGGASSSSKAISVI